MTSQVFQSGQVLERLLDNINIYLYFAIFHLNPYVKLNKILSDYVIIKGTHTVSKKIETRPGTKE